MLLVKIEGKIEVEKIEIILTGIYIVVADSLERLLEEVWKVIARSEKLFMYVRIRTKW